MAPDPSSELRRKLRHPDPCIRSAARLEIAARVRELGGDLERTARELGLAVRTVRRWRDWEGEGDEDSSSQAELSRLRAPAGSASEEKRAEASPPAARKDHDPFADFRPEHRRPLHRPESPTHTTSPTPASRDSDETSAGEPPPDHRSEPPSPRPHAPGSLAETELAPLEPVPSAAPGRRRVAFVLHAHLPWVLGHGRWPHGEEWLTEAALHCYLPLLRSLRRLGADGHRNLLAFSITPVLAAQLADARFPNAMERDLEARLEAASSLARAHPLGRWWERELASLAELWRELGGDLLGPLRVLSEEGVIELSSAAATHPYLPLLHREEHIRLQIRAARENHLRWFGRPARGLWMPECAYRPGGPWSHPVTGSGIDDRPGNESFLQEAGFRWTVVDTHLLLGDEPFQGYGSPGVERGGREPTRLRNEGEALAATIQPALVGDSDVAVFVREPHTARKVWARESGYPGDPAYLDFHKREERTGLRLWRVTDAEAALGDKLPYWPPDAEEALHRHRAHFVETLAELPGLDDGIAVCPYDAELFGHWWFEGPTWLEGVLETITRHPRLETTTPERELNRIPPGRRTDVVEGSWGEGGDHRVWTGSGTAWIWNDLREAEEAVHRLLRSRPSSDRSRAALRQLMLLAASDWPFLITTGTATDYATERVQLHRDRLRTLIDASDGEPLPPWVREDLATLEVNPRWWSGGSR